MVTWRDRYHEWRALYDYCYENYLELEAKGRMRAMTLCLQRTWGEWRRLKELEEAGYASSVSSDTAAGAALLEVQAHDATRDGGGEGQAGSLRNREPGAGL